MVITRKNLGVFEEDVRKDISDLLLRNNKVGSSGINVIVRGDTVVLEGTVPTYAARRHAEELVLRLPSVGFVENQLRVQFPEAQHLPSDAELEAGIMAALDQNLNIPENRITVTARNGVITLRGTVDSYYQKLRAEEFASELVGVFDVRNEIAVTPADKLEDIRIAENIMSAIRRNLAYGEDSIIVNVENGVVTLSGSVPDRMTAMNIETMAALTAGVVAVNNELHHKKRS